MQLQDTMYKGRTEYNLDSCTVNVEPAMDEKLEELRYPENLIKQRKQDVYTTVEGISITGEHQLGVNRLHIIPNRN